MFIEGIQRGYLFCKKWYIKGQGVGPQGTESPRLKLFRVPDQFSALYRKVRKIANSESIYTLALLSQPLRKLPHLSPK